MTEPGKTDVVTDVTTINDQKDHADSTEDTTKDTKLYPQLIACVIVNLTILSSGLSYAWPSISLLSYQKRSSDFHLTSSEESWVVSALPIGSCFGPIVSALLVDRIGRKWYLYLTSIPFLASWILIYYAKSWVYLFAARFLCGFPIGSYFAVVPLYLGELVETRIRGAASMTMGLLLNLGHMIVYGIGSFADMQLVAIICAVPTVLFILLLPWIPESPYYYLKKGNEKEAELSLIWLRGTTNNKKEMKEIDEFINHEKHGDLKDLFTIPVHRKALLLLLLLLAGQQFSGMIAIQSFSGILITNMNLQLNTYMVLLILGAISALSIGVAAFIIDRIGRKPLFLVSTYIVAICVCILGTYFLLDKRGFKVQQFSAIPLVAIIVYYIALSLGLTSIPSVVSSEIFPMSVRSWATAVANMYGAVLAVIVAKCYQIVSDAWGNETIFYIFGGIEIVIATTAIFIMPETSRKSFMAIQEMLNGKTCNATKKEELSEAHVA
ncbi:PREDICTED: facilitated trehalose transporter Tret1-like [Dufourea novaeangliae]|uniref:facilitated trehalose transporter Tret1-like n=1 Tax=Dufourea novaeangliae TaxID=178035 RepID=UPI0007671054|nr:PREDICTED: facilitated trehalose transporter Tret1-like [Dufourea novaeangliae]